MIANLIIKSDFFYLQKEIILHEPHEALYGGISGLDKIKLFLGDVQKYLNESSGMIEFGEKDFKID